MTWGSSGRWGFPHDSDVKNLPALQETRVQSLAQEDPLENGMATHSRILAWRIPRPEEPGRWLQSMGSQKVRHNWTTNTFTFFSSGLCTLSEFSVKHQRVIVMCYPFSRQCVWLSDFYPCDYLTSIYMTIWLSLTSNRGTVLRASWESACWVIILDLAQIKFSFIPFLTW